MYINIVHNNISERRNIIRSKGKVKKAIRNETCKNVIRDVDTCTFVTTILLHILIDTYPGHDASESNPVLFKIENKNHRNRRISRAISV